MAFTEKDMQAQEEQLSTLKDELSRLNQKFDAQLKGMGLATVVAIIASLCFLVFEKLGWSREA